MICSEEAHSNDLYMASSVSFGFTNFVEVMICSTEAHLILSAVLTTKVVILTGFFLQCRVGLGNLKKPLVLENTKRHEINLLLLA